MLPDQSPQNLCDQAGVLTPDPWIGPMHYQLRYGALLN